MDFALGLVAGIAIGGVMGALVVVFAVRALHS